MKTSFIRNMSHEIRTPLNQISGFVQLLTDPNVKLDDSQKKEFNDIIVDQTRHMTKMLNDLIEISEYESDNSMLPATDITVNSILISVMERHAEAKPGVKLIYETMDDNVMITSNHDAIVRILSCLVDNAIKNTDSGSVTVAHFVWRNIQRDKHRPWRTDRQGRNHIRTFLQARQLHPRRRSWSHAVKSHCQANWRPSVNRHQLQCRSTFHHRIIKPFK